MAAEAKIFTFESLDVREELAEACEKMGWETPSKIQVETIPYALQGWDVIGIAQSESGKTGAFAVPIIQALLLKNEDEKRIKNEDEKRIKYDFPLAFFACVISPTRELAIQICEQFEALGSCVNLKCAALVDGVDMMKQATTLGKHPHVVVGTPGRLLDHISTTEGFSLHTIKYLVLDGADRLLDMDFEKVIDDILQTIPRERRTYLFSATMTKNVGRLERAYLKYPIKIGKLNQEFKFIPAMHKYWYLVYILLRMFHRAMIFTRTCESTMLLFELFQDINLKAIPMTGQMSKAKRLKTLNLFKNREHNILICSDVASRGLDVCSVSMVINYEMPTDPKDYIHRVGWTATGEAGNAISLVNQYEVFVFLDIEELIGKKLPELPCCEKADVMRRINRIPNLPGLLSWHQQRKDKGGDKKRKIVDDLENKKSSKKQKYKSKRF